MIILARPALLALGAVLAASLTACPSASAAFERTFDFDSRELAVTNLIGAVRVVQAPGDVFQVTVRVEGRDADENLLGFVAEEGSRGRLTVAFPVQEHRKYLYPALGHGERTTITYQEEDGQTRSWLRRLFHGISGRRITVSGSGNGLEAWADLVIAVPRGRVLHLEQGVGSIDARALTADLELEIDSGPIAALGIEGDLLADTGSGAVRAENITGNLIVDTGSGHVTLRRATGEKVLVDTGSGGVTAEGISCSSLTIDTGSGAVELQLDSLEEGRFVVDTGSGGITLVLPADASAHITADTGSGGISNAVPGALVNGQDRGELDLTVGAGKARVHLDAGSGSISIR